MSDAGDSARATRTAPPVSGRLRSARWLSRNRRPANGPPGSDIAAPSPTVLPSISVLAVSSLRRCAPVASFQGRQSRPALLPKSDATTVEPSSLMKAMGLPAVSTPMCSARHVQPLHRPSSSSFLPARQRPCGRRTPPPLPQSRPRTPETPTHAFGRFHDAREDRPATRSAAPAAHAGAPAPARSSTPAISSGQRWMATSWIR